MFIPIGDENPTERRPYVNYALLALNIITFLVTLGLSDEINLVNWTIVPADVHWYSLFTSMFLHGGWLHLIGNMLFLYIFGDNVEDKFGHLGYVVFYFVTGLAAAAAHIATNPTSEIPTVGASGAISGVMGAYAVFFPRQRVKTLVIMFFITVWHVPALVWIGLWFIEQIFLAANDLAGGVAYGAHIGGLVAGAVIAGAIRLMRERFGAPGLAGTDGRSSGRRPFQPLSADADVDWVDDEDDGDAYSVLLLAPDGGNVGRLSDMVAAVTNESPFDVVDRLVISRGMVARSIPRETAVRVQRELHTIGIPTAIIHDGKANRPPAPAAVEGASWDDRVLRLRVGDQSLQVPWTTPFLYSAARIRDRAFIDVFVNRRTAYRIVESRSVPLTEVDPDGRSERPATLQALAKVMTDRARPTAVQEGLRAMAGVPGGGRLDFNQTSDYDDYVYWVYHLILSKE